MPLNLQSEQVRAEDIWLASLRSMGRSPKTIEIYGYTIGQLSEWRSEVSEEGLETLTRLEALSFTRSLLDRFQPSGVASRLKALRNFFNWCMTEELCADNPFRKVTVSVPDEDQPAVSNETVGKMLAHAKGKHRDVAVITVLRDTGCRKGELAAVEFEDVDLRSGTIHFRESKTRKRSVPLSDEAVVALGRWMKHRPTARKRAGASGLWLVQDPYSLIKAVCRRHSGGTVTPHQFRRRFAIEWLDKGGSESGLMRIAGWSSSEMVRLYTKSHADRLADAEMRRLMG